MPSYMLKMNAYQCEQFGKLIKKYNIKLPEKYVEKALLNDTTCEFNEFYYDILDRIKVADLSEKTIIKYEYYFFNQECEIWCLWRDLNNMI